MLWLERLRKVFLTGDTMPNVVFGLHRDAARGGTLRNPLEVSHLQ